jgi:hypothetical protein
MSYTYFEIQRAKLYKTTPLVIECMITRIDHDCEVWDSIYSPWETEQMRKDNEIPDIMLDCLNADSDYKKIECYIKHYGKLSR